MFLEILLALVAGIIAGTFTGLFPGIHINLVAAGLLASLSAPFIANIPILALVTFIVAMAITHTFIDFIPSVFLGAPEEDSFLSVLPGHQLLIEGRGYEAVLMTLYGGLIALPATLIFAAIFIFSLDKIYETISFALPFILIFASLYLIFREEDWINSGIIFLAAGFLGLFTFNLPIKEPLLPLLTGLFGISNLIISLKSKTTIPKQKIPEKINFQKEDLLKATLVGCIAAPLCSFLPGIGSGHAAVIGSELSEKVSSNKRSFLFLVGMLNTLVMSLSFVTAFAINKTRTGAAVAIKEILGQITFQNLSFIILIALIAGTTAFFLGTVLAKYFSIAINKINYTNLSIAIITILIIVNLFLTNLQGIIVLTTASALGIFCITSNVRRIQLMGCLLIPTITYYLL